MDEHPPHRHPAPVPRHVAYTSDSPAEFPEPTGAFLRAQLGPGYVNIGLAFNQGTVNALPDFTAQQAQEYTVAPAPKGHNEYTLDRLRYRDFSIDLRTAPPAARTWLAEARPTRSWPDGKGAHSGRECLS
ncbi:erythromycin esterase family protein [Streptomyces sp. NPDC050147]|uniref:erythromycin esterase family protein n=1 Tax=Streptomyces sp. NPDC050147 TaxID=3155513 RepID=UPI003440F0B6